MLSFVCLQTIKTEGILALYKGFIPIWVRLGPWNIIVSLVLIFDFEAMGIMNCTMTVYWEIFAKFNFGPFCLHCLGKFKTNLRYQNQLETLGSLRSGISSKLCFIGKHWLFFK